MTDGIEGGDGVIIRKFQSEDYSAVIDLWQKAGLPFKPEGRDQKEKMLQEAAQATASFWVAEHDGAIVASVLGTHDGRKGWINRLAVLPEFRGKGIAVQLVQSAEESLYQKGIEIVACLIEDDNQVSMNFFKRLGYIKHPDILYFSKRKHSNV
jgi:ribosomal protein S18 acetylase RimI-like enzyme